MKVHGLIKYCENDLEKARNELEQIKKSLGSTAQNAEIEMQELTFKSKVAKGIEKKLQLELSLSEQSRKELETQIKLLHIQVGDMKNTKMELDTLMSGKKGSDQLVNSLQEKLSVIQAELLFSKEHASSLKVRYIVTLNLAFLSLIKSVE